MEQKKFSQLLKKLTITAQIVRGHGFVPISGVFWFYKPRNGKQPEQIAVIQQIGDNWRVTKFDRRGPITHYETCNKKDFRRN